MKLLLFSNSTNYGESYFEFPLPYIRDFLSGERKYCLFIPYAGVTISWDDYENRVKEKFSGLGHNLVSIHHSENITDAIEKAEVIVVGGGNTFNLTYNLHKNKLMERIRDKVFSGTPFSATILLME